MYVRCVALSSDSKRVVLAGGAWGSDGSSIHSFNTKDPEFIRVVDLAPPSITTTCP